MHHDIPVEVVLSAVKVVTGVVCKLCLHAYGRISTAGQLQYCSASLSRLVANFLRTSMPESRPLIDSTVRNKTKLIDLLELTSARLKIGQNNLGIYVILFEKDGCLCVYVGKCVARALKLVAYQEALLSSLLSTTRCPPPALGRAQQNYNGWYNSVAVTKTVLPRSVQPQSGIAFALGQSTAFKPTIGTHKT